MVAAELPGLIVPALNIVKLATNTSQQPPRCNSQARSLIQQLWNGVRFALLVIQVSSYLIYRPLLSNLRIFARRCLVVVTALCRPRFACPAVKWKKKKVDRTKQWRLRPKNSFKIAHVRASFYRATRWTEINNSLTFNITIRFYTVRFWIGWHRRFASVLCCCVTFVRVWFVVTFVTSARSKWSLWLETRIKQWKNGIKRVDKGQINNGNK